MVEWTRLAVDSRNLQDEEMDTDTEVPEECCREMKSKKAAHSLVVAQGHGPHIGQLMSCENFSSFHRLLQVTALVLKFVHFLRLKVRNSSESAPTDNLSETDQGSETPNLSCSKTANFLYGSASSTYMLMNFRCGGAVAGCPTQIFPCQLKLRYFLTRITH